MLQIMIVALLVVWCAGYALWTLLPAAARKTMATHLLKRAPPEFLARRLRPYAAATGGCGCDGCDRAPKAVAPAARDVPITFHPRRQR